MNVSNNINTQTLNSSRLDNVDIEFEFTSLPTIKGKDTDEIIETYPIEYTISNFKNIVSVLCEKYSLSPEEFCFALWGIVLKLYNYHNFSQFVSVNTDGSVCVRTIDKDYELFSIIAEQIKNNTISINVLSSLNNYENKTVAEFHGETNISCIDELRKNVVELNNTIRVVYAIYNDELKMFLYCNKNVINSYCLDIIGSLQSNIINELILGKSRISDMKVIPLEKLNLLNSINDNVYNYSINETIPELIENQSKINPDKIAVFYEDKGYKYSEINGKANTIAKILLDSDAKKGDFIPIYMQRSPELIIAILGIMKAGCVFVPIDLHWPIDKVERTIVQCKGKIVLTNIESFSLNTRVNVFFVDEKKIELSDNVNVKIDLEDNIYAIFTSGSTGEPKGAINKHRGIINRFMYMNARYNINDNDVILMTSNHAFDSSVWQMFWPLINGNSTVLPQHSNRLNLFDIITLVDKYNITITDFVPSVFNALVDVLEIKKNLSNKLSTLRQLLIGGEEMSPNHIYKFKKMFPNASITNTYGPAEASIGTVFYELPSEKIEVIPIGKPIDNVKAFVLNENGKLMPPGAIGMLYLGGYCVGNGYVNDIERTKLFFGLIDIFGDGDLRYVYKTGDLVQLNSNRDLDFYGRIDKQVKINGVRVELNEIENEMNKIYGVLSSCAAYLKEDDKKYLLLCYVSNDENITEEYLKKELTKKLPPYILTAYIRKIDTIPLTSNGKINYKRLPSPFRG